MKTPKDTLTGAPCYDADFFLDFLESGLDAAATEKFAAHLELCKRCRLEITRLRKALHATDIPPSGEEARLIAASRERVRLRLFGEVTTDDLWKKGRLILKDFVAEWNPDEAHHFDAVWHFMESRKLLGSFQSLVSTRLVTEVGFVPQVTEGVSLPIVLGLLSNILVTVLRRGLSPQEAVDEHREQLEKLLVEGTKLSRSERRQLTEQFVHFLEQRLPDDSKGRR